MNADERGLIQWLLMNCLISPRRFTEIGCRCVTANEFNPGGIRGAGYGDITDNNQ